MTISHRRTKSREYKTWIQMIQRCTNPKNIGWVRYGGRGITVCARWRKFENFYADMGDKPPSYTIDRVNNDGNYEPGNCRWATIHEQNSNKGDTKIYTAFGLTMSIAAHARKHGIPRHLIDKRLGAGMSIEEAIQTPAGALPRKPPVTQCLRGHAYAEHAFLGNDGAYHCKTCAKLGRKENVTIRVNKKEYHALCEANLRLRDKLLSYAKECSGCEGTGVITVRPQDEAVWGRQLPCPDCEDIREILA